MTEALSLLLWLAIFAGIIVLAELIGRIPEIFDRILK